MADYPAGQLAEGHFEVVVEGGFDIFDWETVVGKREREDRRTGGRGL